MEFGKRMRRISLFMCIVLIGTLLNTNLTSASTCYAHVAGTPQVTKKATCTTSGEQKIYCTKCGKWLRTETIPAKGHSWGDWTKDTNATCEGVGQKHRYCKTCGTRENGTIPALGHLMNGQVKRVDPTCSKDGYTIPKCSRCGKEVGTKTTLPGGHVWSDWTTSPAATCESAGKKQRTCSRCGTSQSETIPALGHLMNGQVKRVEATCTKDGYTIPKCSRCGKEVGTKTTIPAGHVWSDWKTTAATCESAGKKQRTCSRCGVTQTETIPALGHQVTGQTIKVDATCTKDGYTVPKCSRCGKEVGNRTKIPATGHSYDTWITDTKATCEADGTKHRICKKCGNRDNGTIEKLGHQITGQKKTVPATCVKDGYSVIVCSRCNKEMTERTVIKATGIHVWGNWIEGKAVTCEEDGEKHRSCTTCNATESVTVPKPGHLINGQLKTVPADCIHDGYKVVVCSRCGKEMEGRTVLPKTGIHSYGEWKVENEATCEEAGLKYRICSACKVPDREEIPKLGHQVTGQLKTVPASNGRPAYKVVVCSRCGKEMQYQTSINSPTSTNINSPTPTPKPTSAPTRKSFSTVYLRFTSDGGTQHTDELPIENVVGKLHIETGEDTCPGSRWFTVRSEEIEPTLIVSVQPTGEDSRVARLAVLDDSDWVYGFLVIVQEYNPQYKAVEIQPQVPVPDETNRIAKPSPTPVVIVQSDPGILANPRKIHAPYQGTTEKITLSNVKGAVAVSCEDASWITITRDFDFATKSYPGTFTVVIKENKYYTERTATIKFVDKETGKSCTVSVLQDGAPNPYNQAMKEGLYISKVIQGTQTVEKKMSSAKLAFDYSEDSATIVFEYVLGDLGYSITSITGGSDENWVKVDCAKKAARIRVEQYNSYDPTDKGMRSAVIAFTDDSGRTVTVSLSQRKGDAASNNPGVVDTKPVTIAPSPTPTPSPGPQASHPTPTPTPKLVVTVDPVVKIDYKKQTTSVVLEGREGRLECKIIGDAPWIDAGSSGDTVYIHAEKNIGKSRMSTVEITDTQTHLSVKIVVLQNAAPVFETETTYVSFGAGGGEQYVRIYGNEGTPTVLNGYSWYTATIEKEEKNNSVIYYVRFNVRENTGGDRRGNVIVTDSGSGKTIRMNLWQSAAPTPTPAQLPGGLVPPIPVITPLAGRNHEPGSGIVVPPYAIPIQNAYVIQYDANGGTDAPPSQIKRTGSGFDKSIKLSTQEPHRKGYEFMGWGLKPGDVHVAYHPGDTFSVDTDVTLYAIWKRYDFFAKNKRFVATSVLEEPYNSGVYKAMHISMDEYRSIYENRKDKYNKAKLSDELYLASIKYRTVLLAPTLTTLTYPFMPNASVLLNLYLYGNGKKYTYNAKSYVHDNSVGTQVFNKQILMLMKEMERSLLPGQTITFKDSDANGNSMSFPLDLSDLDGTFAMKGCSYAVTGTCTHSGSDYTMDVDFYFQDCYDFFYRDGDPNNQGGFDLGVIGNKTDGIVSVLYVDELAFLVPFGMAKPFEVSACYKVRIFWKEGECNSLQATTFWKDGRDMYYGS